MEPLIYLRRQANNDWLICENSELFNQMAEQLYLELIQLVERYGRLPKVLLVEREPVRFLAGFIAACAAGCPVFLCNPDWVKQEWQQVIELVQPDLILGYGNWDLELRNYYPTLQPQLENSAWIMIPTGGSSGKIRFAIHTWQTLMASAQGFQQYFQVNQINSCCMLPLYHVSGLMQFFRSFISGGQLKIIPFKNLQVLKKIDINPVDFFISLVPTQLQRILQNLELTIWLSQFKTVLLGGAPAWQELFAQAKHHNIRLAPTYGMTETASQIATLKPDDFLQGIVNCGQVLPHAQITICSPIGERLSNNQVGRITIKAKSLALGYYPKLFENQDKFQLDDLGFVDNQGYLNIKGRNSNKIITGGENVYAEEVETAIRATKLVKDICVIGIPDKQWGQAVTALYVPNNYSVCSNMIKEAIALSLSKYKHPKHWISLKVLPRNSQGKINRQQIYQIATTTLHSLRQ